MQTVSRPWASLRPRWRWAAVLLVAIAVGCGQKKEGASEGPAPTPLPAGDVVRVRHILVQWAGAQGAAPEVKRTKAGADSLARSLVVRIKSGEDFGVLAKEHSDDASAAEGGEIAPIEPGETPPEFETVARELKPGQTSDAFESPYGFHIVQRLGMSQLAAQHILIRFHGAKDAPDTLMRGRAEALALAEKILADVKNPEVAFAVAAARYSNDEMTAMKGGYVGEFARGAMVESFEEAVQALEDGQISGIVETPYGFHIIRRVTPRSIRVEHILITHASSFGLEQDLSRGRDEALQRALDVLFRARKGEDFEALAREYSDDRLTAQKGGRLNMISYGQTVPEFEDAAFALEPNQISDVVESPFGFHIIKRLY